MIGAGPIGAIEVIPLRLQGTACLATVVVAIDRTQKRDRERTRLLVSFLSQDI